MFDELARALQQLPSLLTKPDAWESEHKDQGGPEVDRLHVSLPDYRICLHKIYDTPEVAMHSHTWPFAVKILRGRYEMVLATGPEDVDAIATLRLGPGDVYTFPTQRAWHKIKPIDPFVWTVMVNGARWRKSPGLLFNPVPKHRVRAILAEFHEILTAAPPEDVPHAFLR